MITRMELVLLLEDETYNEAAERVLAGEDPVRVLTELRPFIPRYNDPTSRERIEMFTDICRGRVTVN